MDTVLFVTTPPRRCGVSEFGSTTADALAASRKFRFVLAEFAETTKDEELLELVAQLQPKAILYNWHPTTMPWLSDALLDRISAACPGVTQGGVVHDGFPHFARIRAVIHPDPTYVEHGIHFKVGRLLPEGPTWTTPPERPTIGSFGFGFGEKGFLRLVQQVNAEFDSALIRLHVPLSHYHDQDNVERVQKLTDACKAAARPGIDVEVTHHYLSRQELVDWLAGNSINCFFYNEAHQRGISSTIDFALAARRPIAISASHMFRHIRDAEPTILIELSSLREILANGVTPLEPFYRAWTRESLCHDYERIVEAMSNQSVVDLTSNRVLTPQDREALAPVIRELTELCPKIMGRKIPEAVFQNAFNYQQARTLARKGDQILLVGGFEDPIGPALAHLGHHVTITDPDVDGRDMTAVWVDCMKTGMRYDMVVSCSVLEHVQDDVLFLRMMYQVLKPGGVALLTTDFRDDWVPGAVKPSPDVRLYTVSRLQTLVGLLPAGSFVEPPRWRPCEPYFRFEDARYCFCSISFRNVDVVESGLDTDMLLALMGQAVNTAGQLRDEIQRLHDVIACQERELVQRRQQTAAQEATLAHHQDMMAGIGARSLRLGLGVARRVSRVVRVVRGVLGKKSA